MKIYRVQSEANPKKKYKVWHPESGKFFCQCPKYSWERIRGNKDYECKHILRIKEYLKEKSKKEGNANRNL